MSTLRRLTGKSGSDSERGKLVLESSSLIRNSGAFVIEDVIEDLLRSGAWRTYTFPDGTHHEWLDREFDYFISAQEHEWDKIKRSISKPDVLCLIAEHSGPNENAGRERRATADVRGQFPHVEYVSLVSDHVRKIANDPAKRTAFERQGKVMAAVETVARWRFDVRRSGDATLEERAGAIVAKLADDPDLRKRVYQMLDADLRRTRYAKGLAEANAGMGRRRPTA